MISINRNLILVVDDDTNTLKVLAHILRQSGHRVLVANSGESALEKLRAVSPDLIVLDIKMPGINGFETCDRIKSNPRSRDIPVIFMTALSDLDDKIKGFKIGAVDYITKPIRVEEVIARIENQLTIKAAKAEIAALNAELEQRVLSRTAELEAANKKLDVEIEKFRSIFELAPIGMAILKLDGSFIQANEAICEMLGCSSTDLLHRTWIDFIYAEDRSDFLFYQSQIYEGNITDFKREQRCIDLEGKIIYGILQIASICNSEDRPAYLIAQFMNITRQRETEQQLIYNVNHDNLTALPNRNYIQNRIQIAIQKLKVDPNNLFAILFLNIDRFKLVNDSLGHRIGDQLLVAIASRLKAVIRSKDFIARLGGDEFVILLEPIKTIEDAILIAKRSSDVISQPFYLDGLPGNNLFTSVSIGIVIGSPNYSYAEDLLRDADIAMYRAKTSSKVGYEVFEPKMYAQIAERLQLESDLRNALRQKQFQINYQLIVCLHTGRLLGFEALLRWQHEHRGTMSPTEFIPIAEETGLIVPLGTWVLQTACQQLVRWRSQFPEHRDLKMSVNLSIRQLREPNFLEIVDSTLSQVGLEASSLQLELTESMLMYNAEELSPLLTNLREKGIAVSIDDFGTGYSSLSYLHRFPISHLKVDRSFISRMGEQGENTEIVRAIVTLAHQLGMKAIAEGVETSHQARLLREMGCEAAQGYLFAKPLTLQSITNLLAKQGDQTLLYSDS